MLHSQRLMQPLARCCHHHHHHNRIFSQTRINQSSPWQNQTAASYFTNTDRMKADDPYATLGLQWGATTTEIKDAYRNLATKYHPDVNKEDSPAVSIKKFQSIKKAYEKLMDVKGAPHRDDLRDEWSFAVWRNSDIIAQERIDVAGAMRKRPTKPAESMKKGSQWGVAALGHPDGGGNAPRQRRGEYLGDGGKKTSAHSVGTGRNKWVKPKEFKPWNPGDTKVKGVSSLK